VPYKAFVHNVLSHRAHVHRNSQTDRRTGKQLPCAEIINILMINEVDSGEFGLRQCVPCASSVDVQSLPSDVAL